MVQNDVVADDLPALLARIEPEVLGKRIRRARLDLDITQGELAGGDASIGYISRIEAGKRKPEFRLLEKLARRLGTPTESLLTEKVEADPGKDRFRILLDHADLALRGGSVDEAAGLLDQLNELVVDDEPAMAERREYLRALVHEALGQQEDAISVLEDLRAAGDSGPLSVQVVIALSRVYRESGDMSRAIAVGEAGHESLKRRNLEGTDEGVQLVVTLAAAYFATGDVAHAARVCKRAIARAEELNTPLAMASAYWNASVFESERGNPRLATELAEKALHLMATVEGNRNFARLQSELGILQLRLDPPEIDNARANFRAADLQFELSSASPVDRCRNAAAAARADLLSGALDDAQVKAASVVEQMTTKAPLLAASAHVVLGLVAWERRDVREAESRYREAIGLLTGLGSDRGAAGLWFELGTLLEELGHMSEALAAYRSAAAASGVPTTTLSSRTRI